MNQELPREKASLAVLGMTLLLAYLIVPALAAGLPSRDRLLAVLGAPRPTEEEISEMEKGWQQIAASEEPSKVIVGTNALSSNEPPQKDYFRILRRMCLYTTEPDEMQTLLALGRMRPLSFDFDPHLYQYGGFMIYGCGFAVGIGGLLGLVPLRGGLARLLEDPSYVASTYIFARMWPLFFSLLLPVGAYRLARQMTDRRAALLVAFASLWMPGFVHHAPVLKPQSMATTLGLFALASSLRAHRRPSARTHLRAGALHGLLVGTMFTHGVLYLAHLAGMFPLARREPKTAFRLAVLSAAAAAGVFVLTNPYWILSFRGMLEDMRLTSRWYPPNPTLPRLVTLMTSTIPIGLGGFVWTAALAGIPLAVWKGKAEERTLAFAFLVLLGFYAYRTSGTNLSGVWGRNFFLLGPLGISLLVSSIRTWRFFSSRTGILALLGAFLVLAAPRTILAAANLHAEATTESTRFLAGEWIERHSPSGTRIYTASGSPAPYAAPFVAMQRYSLIDFDTGASPDPSDIVVVVRYENEVIERLRTMGWIPIHRIPARRTIGCLGPLETQESEYAAANPTITIWASASRPVLARQNEGADLSP
ncbi:MAG: hypothetical protein KatS3mg014_2690 [Actinomycetota bacterium]|nr:MAG: hypothetical protein KatS3mg014_2690 [Actinomycetota bacterium]